MKCCETELTFAFIGGDSIKVERAVCPKCRTKYDRKKDNDVIYKSTSEGFVCNKCGSEIKATEVHRTVYDSRFTTELAGSGRVRTEQVPYCPKCEKRPE